MSTVLENSGVLPRFPLLDLAPISQMLGVVTANWEQLPPSPQITHAWLIQEGIGSYLRVQKNQSPCLKVGYTPFTFQGSLWDTLNLVWPSLFVWLFPSLYFAVHISSFISHIELVPNLPQHDLVLTNYIYKHPVKVVANKVTFRG